MVLSLLFIILSCVIIWRSSDGFEVAADYLGRKLPAGIKGATINAIASSMPEFLTTLFFLFYLHDPEGFSGGLGVTSGSALFNLLIIPALVVLMLFSIRKGSRVQLRKGVLLREGLVLLLSQVVFISFLFQEELVGKHGLIMVLIYVLYLGLLFFITRSKRSQDPGYVLQGPKKERSPWFRLITLDITHLILPRQKISRGNAWLLLVISTLIMSFGTWLLVEATDRFGTATGIPLIFVAVVLSAAATSVPDTILSIKDARKGNYDDAISNALGSNIFDIAFALGLPILLFNLTYRESMPLHEDVLKFTQEVWAFLLLATVLALVLMLTGKYFTRIKAFLLLLIYLVFLSFVVTQVTGLQEGIGTMVGDYLSEVARWIGRILH